ncbi:TPA: hypothetical protein ACF2YT_001165 [Providencia alcalifaciens]
MREVKPTQKPVPSSDIKDLFFNSGLLDIWATSLERKYIDRFGNCHLTAAGMEWIFNELVTKFKIEYEQALLAAGYAPAGTFQEGADVVSRNSTVLWKLPDGDGDYYRWDGDLPKQVPAGSTPQSTGGIGKGAWVSVGDASLRSDLHKSDGWNLVGAGDITVAGLAYVFTKTKDKIIHKSDLKEWVRKGIESGVTYFSIPPGKYTLKSNDESPFIEIPIVDRFIFDGMGAVFEYDGEVVDSFIKFKEITAYASARNFRVRCNYKINFGISSDKYIGLGDFNTIEIREPLLDGYMLSGWQLKYTNCVAYRPKRDGWYCGSTLDGASTSHMWDTCWVKSPGKGRYGYHIGNMTNCNFINTTFDGDSPDDITGGGVIGLWSWVYGLTVNGMGTENYNGALIKHSNPSIVKGLSINGWHMFRCGSKESPIEYLFDLNATEQAEMHGISRNNSFNTTDGIIRNDTYGRAIAISSDDTCLNWIFENTPSYGYGRASYASLPLPRSKGNPRISVSTLEELKNQIDRLSKYIVDFDVTILLTQSIDTLSEPLYIRNIRGEGSVTITGFSQSVELGSSSYYKPIWVENNSAKIIFDNITLIQSGRYGSVITQKSSNTSLSRSCILKAIGQGGEAVNATKGAIFLASNAVQRTGTWLPNSGFDIVTDGTCIVRKQTESNYSWGYIPA